MVLDFSYIFYPILVLFPPNTILSIVVVYVVVSRFIDGLLPSLTFLVSEKGSIPSLTHIHLLGSFVALSCKRRLFCVPHLYPYWVCVFFLWYWGDIAILCDINHICMSSSRKCCCEFSLYWSNSLLGYP